MPQSKPTVTEFLEAKQELKAILLADTFLQNFLPVTIEKPIVLLPLVNFALIDYALEWLAANAVDEVFVICCGHADSIMKHVQEGKWKFQKNFKVTVIKSAAISAGDALRAMDSKGSITSDFVLVQGDAVTDLVLNVPLQQHKTRREKDRNAIMTLVTKQVAGQSTTPRLGYKQSLLALDPMSQQLLRYQEPGPQCRHMNVDAHLFSERDDVQMRLDLIDCQIAICAPEVLMLFSDNFDYQDIQQDFIPGVLSEEELGNKLFVHVLQREYAARILSPRGYDAVSRDIVLRWAFPFTPDTKLLRQQDGVGPSSYAYHSRNVYREHAVNIARDAMISHDTCIGAGSKIEEGAVVSQPLSNVYLLPPT